MRSEVDRIKTLDSFRGLAALAVVLRHYTTIFRTNYNLPFSSNYDFKYGYLGVELFFMISGFVILMTAEKFSNGKDFLYRRIIRLFPTYWLAIITTFSVIMITDFDSLKISYVDLVLNFSMIQGFFSPIIQVENLDGVYWTLTVELFFYLFISLLLQLRVLKYIKWIGFAWVIWSTVSLYFDFSFFKMGVLLNYWWSPLFYGGILFYLIWKDEKEKKNFLNHFLIMVTMGCYIFLSFIKHEEDLKSNVIDAIVGSSFFLSFYLFTYNKLKWIGEIRFLLFLGKISYPWYLIHQNIGYVILFYLYNFLQFESVFFIIIPVIITMLIAAFITERFERPSYIFLKKFIK